MWCSADAAVAGALSCEQTGAVGWLLDGKAVYRMFRVAAAESQVSGDGWPTVG